MNINALKRKRNPHRGFMGKPEGTMPLEIYICEDGTIILKWILECCGGRARTGSILLGFGTSGWNLGIQ
jgi:hypothetical protein